MTYVPFFRWVAALGLVLFGCSFAAYAAAPELPGLTQIGMTVRDEEPDGTCTVE